MLNDCLEVEKKSLSSSQRCLSVCQIKVRVLNSSLYEKGEEQSRPEEKKRDVRVYAVCRGGRCVRCGAVGLEIIALTILARRGKKRTKWMSRARLTCSPPTRVTFAREVWNSAACFNQPASLILCLCAIPCSKQQESACSQWRYEPLRNTLSWINFLNWMCLDEALIVSFIYSWFACVFAS